MRPKLMAIAGLVGLLLATDAMAQCATCGPFQRFSARRSNRTTYKTQSSGSCSGGVASQGSSGGVSNAVVTQTSDGYQCKCDVQCPNCGTTFKCTCPCQAPVSLQAVNCRCCDQCTGQPGCPCKCDTCKCNAKPAGSGELNPDRPPGYKAPQTKTTNAKLVDVAPDVG